MFINSPIHSPRRVACGDRFTDSPTGNSPNSSVSSDSPIHPFTYSPNEFTDSPIDGVTLIELIVVIAIIGIIVLFATIDTAWFQRNARVTEARDRLLANLEEQKLKSITRYPHGITVPNTTNATSYTLVKLSDAAGADFKRDTGDTASIENLPAAPENPVNLPTNVRIELTGGSTEIWFDRKGVPRTDAWTILNRSLYIWYDADGDGVRDSDEITKRIDMENGGKIQYEQ